MNARKSRKSAPGPRSRRRNGPRRWCIPPAILREPGETLEASQILDEVPGDLGLLLWSCVRDVTLWASVPEERREGLFGPHAAERRLESLGASGAEPQLEVALTTLAAVVATPATTRPEVVTLVCLELARWAREHGRWGTAIAYAQAAALASPEDPAAAYTVGAIAREWGRPARAETWLRRCVGLARRGRDWESYARAHVGLGELHAARQARGAARRFFTQAMRAARRHGLLAVRGTALHGLFLLSLEAGELDEAERQAKAAIRAYGRRHPRLAELLHDVACLWVTRERYGRAIPLLQKLLPSRTAPAERALTLAVLARAAAGSGERRLYEEAWSQAWALVERPGEEAVDARPLLELARAAAKLSDWVRVEQATRLHAARPPRREDPGASEQLAALAEFARR
jgi:tetratricopeptide (TPR) repeat protein